jgi:predicted amidophosphoribosyltransferase
VEPAEAPDDDAVVPTAAKPTPEPTAPEALRICANCGTGNNPARRFCLKCGQKLPEGEVIPPRICPNCSTPNNPARRFCMKCGTALLEAPAEPDPTNPWWRRS